jgi:hypothetical protein
MRGRAAVWTVKGSKTRIRALTKAIWKRPLESAPSGWVRGSHLVSRHSQETPEAMCLTIPALDPRPHNQMSWFKIQPAQRAKAQVRALRCRIPEL